MRGVTSPPFRSLIHSPASPRTQPFTLSSLIFLYSHFPSLWPNYFCLCSAPPALPLQLSLYICYNFPSSFCIISFYALIPPRAHAPISLKCILSLVLARLFLPSPRTIGLRPLFVSQKPECQPTGKLQLRLIINIVVEAEVQVGVPARTGRKSEKRSQGRVIIKGRLKKKKGCLNSWKWLSRPHILPFPPPQPPHIHWFPISSSANTGDKGQRDIINQIQSHHPDLSGIKLGWNVKARSRNILRCIAHLKKKKNNLWDTCLNKGYGWTHHPRVNRIYTNQGFLTARRFWVWFYFGIPLMHSA